MTASVGRDEPVIRRAAETDALLVAALMIQAARAEGAPTEPGFMDRFADFWRQHRDDFPAWWAELEGRHAGLIVTSCNHPLPWPGRSDTPVVRLERLFVVADLAGHGLEESLSEAARQWAAGRGAEWVAR